MASIERTIRRGMMFKNMNKQQKEIWKATHKGNKNTNRKLTTTQAKLQKNKRTAKEGEDN